MDPMKVDLIHGSMREACAPRMICKRDPGSLRVGLSRYIPLRFPTKSHFCGLKSSRSSRAQHAMPAPLSERT